MILVCWLWFQAYFMHIIILRFLTFVHFSAPKQCPNIFQFLTLQHLFFLYASWNGNSLPGSEIQSILWFLFSMIISSLCWFVNIAKLKLIAKFLVYDCCYAIIFVLCLHQFATFTNCEVCHLISFSTEARSTIFLGFIFFSSLCSLYW